jgi:sulfate transport system permease protein
MAMYEADVAVYDSRRPNEPPYAHSRPTTEPRWVRWLLIGIAVTFMAVIILLPLLVVFIEALRKGIEVYLKTFSDRSAVAAIRLTLRVAAISVPLNLVFGVMAAWAVAKYEFWG